MKFHYNDTLIITNLYIFLNFHIIITNFLIYIGLYYIYILQIYPSYNHLSYISILAPHSTLEDSMFDCYSRCYIHSVTRFSLFVFIQVTFASRGRFH